MTQIKELAAKPDKLSSISKNKMIENWLSITHWLSHAKVYNSPPNVI